MAHINEGSITGDNDSDFILYPIVDDGLYSHQFSQPQYTTSAGDIVFASNPAATDVDFTAMLSGEDSTLEDLQDSGNFKTIPPTFYSASGFCINTFDYPHFIPRTIGNCFTTAAAQDSTPIGDSRFYQTQAGAIGYQVGSHTEISDYRSTSSASPTTSIGGFEGVCATHSTSSSTSGSPFSVNEDLWSAEGIASSAENVEPEQGFCSFVGKLLCFSDKLWLWQ